jgi:hypothetical protein
MRLNELGSFLERQVGAVKDETSAKVVSTALGMVKELTVTTPVDTSKALSNWQVSVGETPIPVVLDPAAPGTNGSTQMLSALATQMLASVILTGRKFGSTVYLYNNAAYISQLERGKSKQGSGFVAAAIANGRNRIKAKK